MRTVAFAIGIILVVPAVQLVTGSSISAPETTSAFTRLIAYLLIGLSVFLAFRTQRELETLIYAILVSASFQAAYGAGEYLSGRQQIFAYVKKYYLDSATGTFVNRNHFAAFLAVATPLAFYVAIRAFPRHRAVPTAAGQDRVSLGQLWRRTAAAASLVTLTAGILLSYSRAGILLFSLAVLLSATTALSRHGWRMLLLATAGFATILTVWNEARVPGERLATSSIESLRSESRIEVWSTILANSGFAGLNGVGLGTFEPWFADRTPPSIQHRWDHAHNDWLQGWIEGGWITIVAALVGAGIALTSLVTRPTGSEGPTIQIFAVALAILLAHASVDFVMRIPALALTTAVLIGASLAGAALSELEPRPRSVPREVP
jgi:hypothetical protein